MTVIFRWWLNSVIIAVLLSFTVILFFKLKRKHKLFADLKRENQQLILANREKDKLYSIIAHELRNPLHWTVNITAFLNSNFRRMSSEKLEKSIVSIKESANSTYHLMDDLLQWTRSQLGKIQFQAEHVDLQKLVDENVKLVDSALMYRSIKINLKLEEGLSVFVDKMMLNTVIRNLISNAIKFTPDQGVVTISAQKVEPGRVEVKIIDSGVGIDPVIYADLFDPNKKNTTIGLMNEKGSGIGLVICKEFIDFNKGTITFESSLNIGTTFIITIPSM